MSCATAEEGFSSFMTPPLARIDLFNESSTPRPELSMKRVLERSMLVPSGSLVMFLTTRSFQSRALAELSSAGAVWVVAFIVLGVTGIVGFDGGGCDTAVVFRP